MQNHLNKKGFTLIELLIVVVIIGILAAIAIPRFGETRERAFVSAMQSDLRQVMNAQELYYQQNGFQYFGGPLTNTDGEGTPDPEFAFFPSVGVDIAITGQDGTGYVATANHGSTDVTCDVYVGAENDSGVQPGVAPGNVVCSDGTAGAGGEGEGGG